MHVVFIPASLTHLAALLLDRMLGNMHGRRTWPSFNRLSKMIIKMKKSPRFDTKYAMNNSIFMNLQSPKNTWITKF